MNSSNMMTPQNGISLVADKINSFMGGPTSAGKRSFAVFDEDRSSGFANSIWIYMKLFMFYPAKYLLLLTIAIFIYKIILQVYHFGNLAYKHLSRFAQQYFACTTLQPCTKGRTGRDCCVIDLLFFKSVDIVKLITGALEFFIGFVYLCVAISLLVFSIIMMIPFNTILPSYKIPI